MGNGNLSAMTRAQFVASREEAAIKLKAITLRFPANEEEAMELDQDLEKMGCGQLRHRPWGLRSVHMVKELKAGAPN